ncbi:Phosphotransferase family protein [Balamuthia mandrillaris]
MRNDESDQPSCFPAHTGPVREAHRFSQENLCQYMRLHVRPFSGHIRHLAQFDGGQSNPTFWIMDTDNRQYVLRKKPPGKLLPSAHAVEREYQIIRALQDTPVPVPKTYCLCEDASVLGTPFYIMEYLQGRVLRDPLLPEYTPAQRAAIYDAMNETLAKLHNVDVASLPDNFGTSFGRPGNYYARQVSRWSSQYEKSRTEHIPAMESLIEWLRAHIPSDDSKTVSIVHGDFRLENLIFHPTEAKVIAVLDWELSTLGHPLADLAYNCMPYVLPAGMQGTYPGLMGIDLASLGIPTQEQYVAAYCKRTHRKGIDNWPFYLSFSIFRSAAILQGVYKRAQQGNASSTKAKQVGAMAGALAALGWQLVSDPASFSSSTTTATTKARL